MKKASAKTANSQPEVWVVEPTDESGQWDLRLYVAGQSPKSITAFNNLKRLCEEHLDGKYKIQVIDLVKNPTLAREHQIVAIPTLVKRIPMPLRKIIGDLSDTDKALVGLQLREAK